MTPTFASQLDALSAWRSAIDTQLGQLGRFAREHDLLDEDAAEWFDAMRVRLAGDKLIVAFVAEFSRGKSELINAIFFAGSGRRMLPATPGRTTMCPVELGYDADEPVGLSLLPIETRLENISLTELYKQPKAWKCIEIDLNQPDQMAQALTEVMRTRAVSVDEARALGFWDDERPDDNPPPDANGQVDVPVWRHARINLPHPLLKRGLVVLDTPGLNAIGTEPELTLGLLPTAHATVFILGADTGVTKSDLSIWRDHLSGPALARFVALNKIDALADPLSAPAVTLKLIDQQCDNVARDLGLQRDHIFPISARQALAARVEGNTDLLQASRILALEQALSEGLLPKRRETLEQATVEGVRQLQGRIQRKLSDARRQTAEQLLELRGLRGKSSGKVQLMLKRAQAEAAEFEACTSKLSAMRSVHSRMLKDALVGIASDKLREPVDRFQEALSGSFLQLGAKKAFTEMCAQLRRIIEVAQVRSNEIHAMLSPTFAKLNAEYGFGLSLDPAPDLLRFAEDLSTIERNYVQYLGLGQAIKLAQPRFQAQFRRMLVSRLRVVFENASGELELWNKTASAQVDTQLRERRRTFKRRQESLERIQTAAGELEERLGELQSQDDRTQQIQSRLTSLVDAINEQARSPLPLPRAAAADAAFDAPAGAGHLRLIEPSREPGLQAQA
jgi:methyl-accepting chemotaxis protein